MLYTDHKKQTQQRKRMNHVFYNLCLQGGRGINSSLYNLCLRLERDESRPYGSRPIVYNMENHVLRDCQRVAMRQPRGVIFYVPPYPSSFFSYLL